MVIITEYFSCCSQVRQHGCHDNIVHVRPLWSSLIAEGKSEQGPVAMCVELFVFMCVFTSCSYLRFLSSPLPRTCLNKELSMRTQTRGWPSWCSSGTDPPMMLGWFAGCLWHGSLASCFSTTRSTVFQNFKVGVCDQSPASPHLLFLKKKKNSITCHISMLPCNKKACLESQKVMFVPRNKLHLSSTACLCH